MWDTHIHNSKEYVPYEKEVRITKHVHRAPTDKSVELLNEFQDKAKSNIVDLIRIQDNTINGVVTGFSEEIVTDDIQWFATFTLNGKKHRIKGKCSKDDFKNDLIIVEFGGHEVKIHKFMFKEFVKKVAEHLFADFIGAKNAIDLMPLLGLDK